MKKILFLTLLIFCCSCSYTYEKSGQYKNTKTQYRFKESKNIFLNVNTSLECSGHFCTNRPMLERIESKFLEYNINVYSAKNNNSKQRIKLYNTGGGFVDAITTLFGILSLGIIPMCETRTLEFTFEDGYYETSFTETQKTWTGWFIIPFSNPEHQETTIDDILNTGINKVIKDGKFGDNYEDISNKPQKLQENTENK